MKTPPLRAWVAWSATLLLCLSGAPGLGCELTGVSQEERCPSTELLTAREPTWARDSALLQLTKGQLQRPAGSELAETDQESAPGGSDEGLPAGEENEEGEATANTTEPPTANATEPPAASTSGVAPANASNLTAANAAANAAPGTVTGNTSGNGSTTPTAAPLTDVCSHGFVAWPAGTVQVTSVNFSADAAPRPFGLYIPASAASKSGPLPLWVLAPGTEMGPEAQVLQSNMFELAEREVFAVAALKADNNRLNVGVNAQSEPGRPDDVAYVRAVLQEAQKMACVDEDRIYCTGYSRGGRFCSRLASEMPAIFAAIAPVSGVRFPDPNNCTKPMPVLAFHGTADKANPFAGHGAPYWGTGVMDAVEKWAKFNKCTKVRSYQIRASVTVIMNSGCAQDANVGLVQIEGGGHTWPGSDILTDGLGATTHEFDAGLIIADFFGSHPRRHS